MPFVNRRILLAVGLILLMSVTVSAETLTLDQCIELALKNHPNVISARGNVRSANGRLWNAFGDFLPSVGVSGQVSQTNLLTPAAILTENDSIITTDIYKNYNLSLYARWTVFDGGRNLFDYFASKANKAANKYNMELSEQNLIQTVKSYYYAYLASLKLAEVNKEAVKRGEEQLKLAQSKFEVGSASKSDVLKAKVQYGNDRLNLIDSENGVRKAKADLAYIVGVDVNSEVDFSSDYSIREYDGSEMDALKYGMSNYPGLLARERSLSAAKNGVRSVWGSYLPSITVSYQRYYNNDFWHEVNKLRDEDGRWNISTTVNLPIFENFSRKSAMSSAKASLNNAKADYYYARNSVALEIKKAFLDMTRAKEKLTVSSENEAAALEDMNLVQEKYDLGAATILELLDAQVSLITAQNDKVQSEFDYNLAVAKLENVMGVR